MNISEYFDGSRGNEMLRGLPPVLRARDFHLYLDGGRRLVDLWQLGGRAILGHKPARAVTELKNAAERGLFAALPHPAENRFYRALAKLFVGNEWADFSFRMYSDKSVPLKIPEIAGLACSPWRPFQKEIPLSSVYVPVLPWALSPIVLAVKKSLEKSLPPADLIPPVILAPATRALHDLAAIGENGGRPRFPRLEKAAGPGKNWVRDSVYLFPALAVKENWPAIWGRFLEQGFLLPPSPRDPAIIPGLLSKGEEDKLAALLEA